MLLKLFKLNKKSLNNFVRMEIISNAKVVWDNAKMI